MRLGTLSCDRMGPRVCRVEQHQLRQYELRQAEQPRSMQAVSTHSTPHSYERRCWTFHVSVRALVTYLRWASRRAASDLLEVVLSRWADLVVVVWAGVFSRKWWMISQQQCSGVWQVMTVAVLL